MTCWAIGAFVADEAVVVGWLGEEELGGGEGGGGGVRCSGRGGRRAPDEREGVIEGLVWRVWAKVTISDGVGGSVLYVVSNRELHICVLQVSRLHVRRKRKDNDTGIYSCTSR